MKKGWLLLISLVLVLAIFSLVGCRQGTAFAGEIRGISIGSQQEGIWVSGVGKVTAIPDVAILRLGIESQEATVAAAQKKATEAMTRVKNALTGNGVAEKDIQTRQFSIQKVTRWDKEKGQEVVVGYRVTNIVTAKIRNLDKAGSIIDAVAEAGGDFTRIDGISFSVDDPSPYHKEARDKAMAEAKAKANQLAGLAGVTLGKPTYISESLQVSPPIPIRGVEMAVAAAPTPISPGEIEITLNVQVAYAIQK